MTRTFKQFSATSIRRLPEYHAFLEQISSKGEECVSSTTIAKHLNFDPIVVRKDLESIGAVGRPKIGFKITELTSSIKEFMGWGRLDELIIVGCGDLGSALMGYGGFTKRGFKIVAGFDNDPSKIGSEIHGISIFSVEKLENLIRRLHVEIGIITVPSENAQQIADLLVNSGIKGIWNFSTAALNLPQHISVQQEDLITSLVILQKNIQCIYKTEKKEKTYDRY